MPNDQSLKAVRFFGLLDQLHGGVPAKKEVRAEGPLPHLPDNVTKDAPCLKEHEKA